MILDFAGFVKLIMAIIYLTIIDFAGFGEFNVESA